MREILFRGKTESGGWKYGALISAGNYCCILDEDDGTNYDYPYLSQDTGAIDGYATPVNPATVGQFTGLTDKNGKKIFEGDIVKREYTLWHSETKRTRETQIGVVSYSNKECGFFLDKVCNLRKPWDGDTIEIIGNIHDNPELLEV